MLFFWEIRIAIISFNIHLMTFSTGNAHRHISTELINTIIRIDNDYRNDII